MGGEEDAVGGDALRGGGDGLTSLADKTEGCDGGEGGGRCGRGEGGREGTCSLEGECNCITIVASLSG